MMDLEDGVIDVGTERGDAFGFTSDKFRGWLWKSGERVAISFIESVEPGQGHFKALVAGLHAAGFTVAVPTPLGKMEAILKRWGFVESREYWERIGDNVEIWSKGP